MRSLLFISCFLAFSASAQKARAFWEKDSVLVGEPAVLRIVISKSPEEVKWTKLTSSDKINIRQTKETLYRPEGEIEVVGTSKKFDRKKKETEIKCTVLVWDTANYKIPDQLIDIYKKNWKSKDTSLYVSIPELTVTFKKKVVDTNITEIKLEEITSPWAWLRTYGFSIALLIILLTALILWNKRNRTVLSNSETLKAKSIKKLRDLEKKALWEKGQTEKHYVEFSGLLKDFLAAKYNLNFRGKTTMLTETQLRSLNVEPHITKRIKNLLLASDFSKFGKNLPSAETIRLNIKQLEELIIELSPLDIPK